MIVLLTTQGMKREIGVNQEKAIFILKSHNIRYTVVDGADPKLKKRRNQLFQISNIKGQYPQFFVVDPKDIIEDDDGTRFWGDMEKFEESNENHTLKQDLFMIYLPSSPRSKKKGLFSRFKNKKGNNNEIGIMDSASIDSSDDDAKSYEDVSSSIDDSNVSPSASPKKKRGFLRKIIGEGKSEEVGMLENNDVDGDDDKKEQVELLENKDDDAEVLLQGPSEVEVVCIDDVEGEVDKKGTDHQESEESRDVSLETSKEEEMQLAGTENDSSSANQNPIVVMDEQISEILAVETIEMSNESDVIKDSTTEGDEAVTKVIATDDGVVESMSSTNETIVDEKSEEIDQVIVPEILIASDENDASRDLPSTEKDVFTDKDQMIDEKFNQPEVALDIASSAPNEGSDTTAANEAQAEGIKPDEAHAEAEEIDQAIEPENTIASDEKYTEQDKVSAESDAFAEGERMIDDKLNQPDVLLPSSDITPIDIIQGSDSIAANGEEAIDTKPDDDVEEAISGTNETVAEKNDEINQAITPETLIVSDEPNEESDLVSDENVVFEEKGQMSEDKFDQTDALLHASNIASSDLKEGSDLVAMNGVQAKETKPDDGFVEASPSNKSDEEHDADNKIDNADMDETIKNVILDEVDDSEVEKRDDALSTSVEDDTKATTENADGFEGESGEIENAFDATQGHTNQSDPENEAEHESEKKLDTVDIVSVPDDVTHSNESGSPTEAMTGSAVSNADEVISDFSQSEGHEAALLAVDNEENKLEGAADENIDNNDAAFDTDQETNSSIVSPSPPEDPLPDVDEEDDHVIKNGQTKNATAETDNSEEAGKECNDDAAIPAEEKLESLVVEISEDICMVEGADQPCEVESNIEVVLQAEEKDSSTPDDNATVIETQKPVVDPRENDPVPTLAITCDDTALEETQTAHEQESVEVNQKAGVQEGPVKSTKSVVPVAKKLVLPGIFSKSSSSDDASSKEQESQKFSVPAKRRVGIPSAFGGKNSSSVVNQSEGSISQESRIATPKCRVGIPAAFGGKASSLDDETKKGISQVEPQKRVIGRVSIPSYSSAEVASVQSGNTDDKSGESGLESQRDLQTGPVKPQKEVLKPAKKLNLPGVFGGSSTSSNTGWRKSVSDDAEPQTLGGPVRAQKEELKAPKKLTMPGIFSQNK